MISKKAKNLSPAITLAISSNVKKMQKKGKDIINLSIGEPDFFTPEDAKNGGKWAIDNNKTKYGPASGNPELKEEIVKKLKEENNVSATVENIVISNGAKQAITNSFFAILNSDDEVLIPTPCWVSYPEIVKLAGGKPVFVKTNKEDDFLVNCKEIENALTNKTKAIIINNPSNPTGAVYDRETLEEIAEFAVKNNLMILSDEIYERLAYDGEFTSLWSFSDKIKENTIIVNGFSKAFSMTGWRLGYTVASKEVTNAISSIQSHITSHPSTISQYAGLYALQKCKDEVEVMRSTYKKRRDMIVDFFDKWNKLSIIKPSGAFYIFMDISSLKDKLEGSSKSFDFCSKILDKEGVALIPGAGFEEDNFVRMSYAASEKDIKRGLEKIKKFVESL